LNIADYMESDSLVSTARRSYDNSRRQADAEARQHRIIEAATELFVEQGFTGTSIDQIAVAADVSAQTVYATYGSKAGVLKRAIDIAVVGDFEAATLADRLPVLDLSGRHQPAFATAARFVRALHERVAPLMRVMLQAGLEDMRLRLTREMRASCAVLVAQVGPGLRPGLSKEKAADVLVTVQSPYLYLMYTGDLGWTPDQYEKWLADALPRLLLRPELLSA
jgi:AcrR family transcriptional regulator